MLTMPVYETVAYTGSAPYDIHHCEDQCGYDLVISKSAFGASEDTVDIYPSNDFQVHTDAVEVLVSQARNLVRH